MNPHRPLCLLLFVLAVAAGSRGLAGDWLTLRSSFTHDPATGSRVNQFAKVEAPPLNDQSRLITSGYTNYRSTIQVGQSADNYYRVDQWGPPVRPYGEWLFPYRPYSSPYEAWGAPLAGLNLGFGVPPHYGQHPGPPRRSGQYPGGQYPGGGIPGQPVNPYPIFPGGAFPEPPWYEGFHPDRSLTPRLNDQEFFDRP